MEKTKIIMEVMASNSEIYDDIILNYWIPIIKYISREKLENEIQIFLVFGKDTKTDKFKEIEENIITVSTEETIKNMLMKTILGLKEINKLYEYNYLVRTNLSSFWIIDKLISLTKILPENKLYAGPNTFNKFISGCGIIMSRDVSEKLLHKKFFRKHRKHRKHRNDDVIIGKLIRERMSCFLEYSNYQQKDNRSIVLRLENKNMNRVSLEHNILYLISTPIEEKNFEKILNFIKENSVFHIRIKSTQNRLEDLKLFNYLSKKIYIKDTV